MDKDKEIKRLKSNCNKLAKMLDKEIEKNRKAVEYIKNNDLYYQDYDFDYEENLVEYPPSDEQARRDLLEILEGDKENETNN